MKEKIRKENIKKNLTNKLFRSLSVYDEVYENLEYIGKKDIETSMGKIECHCLEGGTYDFYFDIEKCNLIRVERRVYE